jgi:hypothetical protein
VKSLRTALTCAGILCFAAWTAGAQGQQNPQEEHPLPPGSSSLPKVQAPPPPPPKVPDVRQPGETGWWVEFGGWFPTQQPVQNAGHAFSPNPVTELSTTVSGTIVPYIQLQGKPKLAESAEVGIALGLHNALRFSYWESRASGDIPSIANNFQAWGQTYAAGTWISTNYRIQNAKISFDYLTWPYPVESRRFRLKTLWQVQYTGIRTGFDAPQLPLVDNTGAPIVDANGNPISYAAIGSRWFIYPEFGLEAQYFSGRHLRLEANASGFAFPHKDTVWDADASANLRFGKIEFRLGAKAFHFKTSPQAEYYMRGTPAGAFVGVRWHSE